MAEWKVLLNDALAERWAERQCYLIAQVKPLLTAHDIDAEALIAGRQMRHFLKAEAPELRQIQNELQPTNWGIVPVDAQIERPHEQYFGTKDKKPVRSEDFPYQNAMRVAFSKAIPVGMRRFVMHTPVRFVDLPNELVEQDGIEVSTSDIAIGASDAQITNRIAGWIGRHKLSASNYRPPLKSSSTKSPKTQASALHDLFDILPESDLARISFPLDIIRSLLSKPGNGSR